MSVCSAGIVKAALALPWARLGGNTVVSVVESVACWPVLHSTCVRSSPEEIGNGLQGVGRGPFSKVTL